MVKTGIWFYSVALCAALGLFSVQIQADQPGVPDGKWFGNITSQCTIGDGYIHYNLRSPHFEINCSSGRCFAEFSCQLYDKETDELQFSSIPIFEKFGYRLTLVGWGPISSRRIESGSVVSSDDHNSRQNEEAHLDGLSLTFLPNDDLSVSINLPDYDVRCSGILLPKL